MSNQLNTLIMSTLYKVLYNKIDSKTAETKFSYSVMFTDKEKAIKKCEQFAQAMRNVDYVVSQFNLADYYIWIREYEDRNGELKPILFRPYESIEDGVLKTPHLSVHHDYFHEQPVPPCL